MEPHVVEALDVGQPVLGDGQAELRLVDLHPRGAEPVQQAEGAGDVVAPAPVPQLDRDGAGRKRLDEPREVVVGGGVVAEAGGELREQGPELAGLVEGRDGVAELLDVPAVHPGVPGTGGRREHPRVGELLVELDGEREVVGGPRRPGLGGGAAGHAVEGRVHLDGVEVLGVAGELVEPPRPMAAPARRIEDAVPGPGPARVVPPAGADADPGPGHRAQAPTASLPPTPPRPPAARDCG